MSDPTPNARLSAMLLQAGWQNTPATAPDAYMRHGSRFRTWRKNSVTVATSACELYLDTRSNQVMQAITWGDSTCIEVFMVEPSARHQGRARAALLEWTTLAKNAGATLYLEPVPQEPAVKAPDLLRLYLNSGFHRQDDNHRILACVPA